MSLINKVEKGRKMKPLAIMVAGEEGVGKTTFADKSPNPIFIGAEEHDVNSDNLPSSKSYKEFMDSLDLLLKEDHNYKTVVVDTIDSIEFLVQQEILSNDSADSMAKACGGYGAGYVKASNMMSDVRRKLSELREKKKMNIIIIAHTEKVKFEEPISGISYDTYQIKLDKRSKPIFSDWVQCILFAGYKNHRTKNSSGKECLIANGERVLFTEKRPGHEGKNRFNLPYEMKLDFDYFIKGVKSFYEQ